MLARDAGNFFFLHVMPRWIAGADARAAVAYCGKHGPCVVNYLGEHYDDSSLVRPTVEEYKRLIGLLSSGNVKASIAIKPSQFGLSVLDVEDPMSFCEEMMLEVVRCAGGRGVFTWLDMEDFRSTDFTLDFYCKYAPKHPMGVCLQANLTRTPKDLARLIGLSQKSAVRVRLVKGAYKDKPEAASGEVHAAFLVLIRAAFAGRAANLGVAVASHHPEAVELALKLQKENPKPFFEIEMLKGVRPQYQDELRRRGVPLAIYVPYGKDVFAYSVRRAMKDPGLSGNPLLIPFFDAYKKLNP